TITASPYRARASRPPLRGGELCSILFTWILLNRDCRGNWEKPSSMIQRVLMWTYTVDRPRAGRRPGRDDMASEITRLPILRHNVCAAEGASKTNVEKCLARKIRAGEGDVSDTASRDGAFIEQYIRYEKSRHGRNGSL